MIYRRDPFKDRGHGLYVCELQKVGDLRMDKFIFAFLL